VRTKWLLIALVALSLVGAACGDDNTVSVPPPQAVEKSTAIANGDAICAQLRTDVQQLLDNFKAAKPNPSAEEARDFLTNTLLPRIDRGVGDLHRIGEPTKDKAPFDAAVKSLDNDLSTLKTAAGADPVKVATSKVALFDTSANDFADYGFKECGKN
jgi:hypothetical protein